jgi:soluble lytic murein transglycosylase
MYHAVLLAAALLGPAPVVPETGTSAAAALHGDTAAVRRAAVEVRAGLAHANARNAAAAAAAYARAAALVPAFAPWAHALSASAVARGGDTAAVRRHFAASDPLLVREWGWRARVDAALASGDTSGAARIAAAAAAELGEPARRAQAWARAGAIHAAAGRRAEAAVALRRAIDESIGAAAAVDAARLLGELPVATAEDRLRIGRVYLRHGNMTRAAEGIDAYLTAAQPPAVERAELQLDLGRALFNARDYAGAERRLRAAANAGGSRETSADAALLLGRSLYRQSRTSEARAAFLRLTRDFPGTRAAAQAHFIIGDIDHDAGDVASAKAHYRAAVDGNGPDAPLAATRLGSFALLERRPREAAAIFEAAYRRATGAARQQPGYWFAHSLDAAGTAGARDSARQVFAEVRRMDPFTYYGLRSGERLGAGLWDFEASRVSPAPASVRAEVAAGLDALDLLRAAELTEAAALEAARLVERFAGAEGALYSLGDAYHVRGQTFDGVRLGRELLRREGAWNRALLALVYPFPYRDTVLREARANGLDPFLVAGLIRQESMFNARARSPAGAIGLMQVMPQTGTAMARTLGITGFNASRLTDPALNVRIGTRFLADQIRRYDGRLVDAIAAYNAGPTRLTRWRTFPEHADPEIFTERIPFQETREYVKIVQQNARIYRELYGTVQ